MKVLVGVSGGVDSAVALHLLKSQGHSVIGAMMKIYDGEIKTIANSCYGTDKIKEEKDAIANCEHVGCEFVCVDLAKEFDEIVFSEFKKQYLSGLTPNPCVMCNKLIKFGAFPNAVKKLGINFDKFATGHYARNEFNETSGRWDLKKGINPKKDQTYFLYRLSQTELSNILFPLGAMQKEEVREYALKNKIPVAQKSDSQDFYKGDYSELFDVEVQKGELKDRIGNVLGYHDGIWNYTIGQRKGLKIAYKEPLYVLDIDSSTNSVIVGVKDETFCNGLIAKDVNWVALNNPKEPFEASAKIRSASNPVDVVVYPAFDEIKVEFREKISSIAPSQAVVLYKDDIVLGGATIVSSF
ncbi:MAG: tRNA 2-thiouridine(34) synthase MnmA [Candidatus Gastranaerophilales bacterium]|nr:tRNA 2-thiouridine(34) synthase MnmA [Candidatus Gastranaerophilales bacterium]